MARHGAPYHGAPPLRGIPAAPRPRRIPTAPSPARDEGGVQESPRRGPSGEAETRRGLKASVFEGAGIRPLVRRERFEASHRQIRSMGVADQDQRARRLTSLQEGL